ncbi:uncharacterized protein TNCT_489601 [Trichonephila clavata]|uniref:MULE transposase domain-containing protein n=1 Tax=Trichonephila clavata TaxID=2740835 RepID=A0A8X6HRD9_TRICU|nr:uncharacterized protein TNCT_489601 [Trichonephila clavata]
MNYEESVVHTSTHESSKEEMLLHFQEVHDVKIENVELAFINFEAFNEWRNRTEKETKSKFIVRRGAISLKNGKKHHFVGHRSGFYVSKGKGLSHLKTQGSNKIDGYCPAQIKVFVSETGATTKIASKIPFDEILDEIRDSVTDSKLERIHLLTKNIENCFNIGSNAIKHKDDGTSVDAWVNEMESKNDFCILFYKPQGVTSAMYPELKSDYFVLIIMNDKQYEMLQKKMSHICIDGTHRTNGYDFELITLLTLDDMRQGSPCSFLISNRTDHSVLEIFFAKIKEKAGEICPTVFMSDMAESFFNVWSNTSQSKPKHKLFCTWQVDRAWRKIL